MIGVFIIASAPTMRVGLRTVLSTREIQVVGEASTPAELTSGLAEIDVVVVADEELLQELPPAITERERPALIVLSSDSHRLLPLMNTLSSHGWGVVSPDASTGQLQAAVSAVAQGLIVLSTIQAEQTLDQQRSIEFSDIDPVLPGEALTMREREVLLLLSEGLPNKLIARRLQISEHTVKFHVSSIYAKLGATSRTDAVSRGVRRGLITL
ncbi:MAG TPA: response regulator transcription factor [Ktedonobacteraceae bacterium]|jgi:DNA-binding NarL/FixJ family response regulator